MVINSYSVCQWKFVEQKSPCSEETMQSLQDAANCLANQTAIIGV